MSNQSKLAMLSKEYDLLASAVLYIPIEYDIIINSTFELYLLYIYTSSQIKYNRFICKEKGRLLNNAQ